MDNGQWLMVNIPRIGHQPMSIVHLAPVLASRSPAADIPFVETYRDARGNFFDA
jgi:hypothetical protein